MECVIMKSGFILGPMIPAVVLAAGMTLAIQALGEEAGAPVADGESASPASRDPASKGRTRLARLLKEASLSPGVVDVGRLGAADAGELVLLAYVNHSETAYRLRAEDITYLREHAVPDSIIAAMIERGAILRERQTSAAPAPQPVPPVQNIIHAAPQPANTVVFIPAPASVPAQPVSTVTVIGRSYPRRGLSRWNRPYVYSRPGQWRNNYPSYSTYLGGCGTAVSYARPVYKHGFSNVGYPGLACR